MKILLNLNAIVSNIRILKTFIPFGFFKHPKIFNFFLNLRIVIQFLTPRQSFFILKRFFVSPSAKFSLVHGTPLLRRFEAIPVLFLLTLGYLGLTPLFGLPAFPGAEGYGANTIGGRGGKVIKVTNLAPSGPGSFKAASERAIPRIIIFETDGNTLYSKESAVFN